tara:strand:+ start:809 stop:1045 length:237 start_codon:yes stop_codon:yes gene_type:complete
MNIKLRKFRILEIVDKKDIPGVTGLAEKMGMQQSNMSQLLNNHSNFTKETLEKLLTTLECDLMDIVEIVSLDESESKD